MKTKILKQFGAIIASICILYGIISTAYRSYENLLASQIEVPAIVLAKERDENIETEITTPIPVEEETATNQNDPEIAAEEEIIITESVESVTIEEESPVESAPVEEIVVTAPVEEEIISLPEQNTSDNTSITTDPDVPTLSEYLSQFRCGGCGKNCSLLNPRCGRGQQKAQQTESEYYALYS